MNRVEVLIRCRDRIELAESELTPGVGRSSDYIFLSALLEKTIAELEVLRHHINKEELD
jgi:hypothetical protein